MKKVLAGAVLGVVGLVVVGVIVVAVTTLAYSAIQGNPHAQALLVVFLLVGGVSWAVSWAVGVLYNESNRPWG